MNVFPRCMFFRKILFYLPLLVAPLSVHGSAAQGTMSVLDRARAMAQAGQLAEAELLLEEAHRTRPANGEILLLLAKVEGHLGHPEKAAAILQQLMQSTSRKPELLVDLAIALGDQRNFQSAMTQADAAIRLQPNLVSAHFVRARLLNDLHRLNEADVEYSWVERREPHNTESLFLHALLMREMSDLPKETVLLKKLVKLEPRNDYAFYLLGRSLLEQKSYSEAIAAFRSSLALNPKSKETTYSLARALRKERPHESEELMQSFQSLRGEDKQLDEIKTLANQGVRAEMEKNYREAIQNLTQALERCGECEVEAGIRRNLGLALCHAGDLDEGAKQLHLALKLDPSDSDAARALKTIGR